MNLLKKLLPNLNFSIFRSQKGIAPLVIIVAVAIMAAAVPTTVILVQQEQDNRQLASDGCARKCNETAGEVCHEGYCRMLNDKSCNVKINGDKDAGCVSGICIEDYCRATTNPPGGKCGEDEDCDVQQTGHSDSPYGRNCRDNRCVYYKLPEDSECYTDLQCLNRQCRPGIGSSTGKRCFGRDPSPTSTPVPTNAPTPRATSTPTPTKGVINTTPGLTPIQARGSLGITINSNGVEYTRVISILHVFGGIALEEYDDTKRSSNAHRWDIDNRTWSNINSYQFVTNVYQGEKIIKTERHAPFKVASSPIVVDYTVELDPSEIENPESTNTPTPEDRQGENERIQGPTATPRPIEWCREDGDQGQGQGCCSNSSCQPNLKCTGSPTPGGLRCCPANTYWDGTACASTLASCQSLTFSCVPNSTKPGEQCCSPQFYCDPVGQRCIENTAPTSTPIPNATATPTPVRPTSPPTPTVVSGQEACYAFGGQNGCTAWCQRSGGGGLNSYCDATCSSCLQVTDGSPSPTVADSCAVFGSHAACNTWCQSSPRNANGCNTDCNGCY